MVSVRLQKRVDLCKVCHGLVAEVLTKLEDPDTQLEIIQTLLKGCNKVDNFVQEIARLVFENGPIILADAEKFVATTNICAVHQLCKADLKTLSLSLGELFISSDLSLYDPKKTWKPETGHVKDMEAGKKLL